MKIVENTSTHLSLQQSAIVTGLVRLFCGVVLVLGSIVLIINHINEKNISIFYTSGLFVLLGGIGIFFAPHKTFYFDNNQSKLTIESERLLGKHFREYSFKDISVRVKRTAAQGKKGEVVLVFYKVILGTISHSRKINFSWLLSASYFWQREQALEFAELIRSFLNTSYGKPLQQQVSNNLKQKWDVDGEIPIKILQHTPTHLTLKDQAKLIWTVRLISIPFLILGILGLLLCISEKIFPNLPIIIFLVLGILGVFFPSNKRVEFDKSENKLSIKIERFLYVKKMKYSLDDVNVFTPKRYKTHRRGLRHYETDSWVVILQIASHSKKINLSGYAFTRYAASEIADLIRFFLNKPLEEPRQH
ncbi:MULTISPECIES: hypothetical protein [unclassified Coleofasciculus]|uniref:hypothetical protein n=1 Tax=unclassified Coleofasciculus TaxID=2692782 RepID=UPI0018821B4A|nr:MULTISPECIES: hypothetical protein [unclassified Coleofasciculus]MBE9128053.1 hypothetical protein [Coleofasciculus sp. LEGE 07081]MBE9149344.1 hypothetical protein [Coleofasciculus sp. LEGE 07092]